MCLTSVLTSPTELAMPLVQSPQLKSYSIRSSSITLSTCLQLADLCPIRFKVPSQAYLAAEQVNNPATTYGAVGIMGMSFDRLSSIDMTVNQTGAAWGRSLLYNIFALNPAEPNYMTMMLERVSDPNEQVTGTFTIGMCYHSQLGRMPSLQL